MLQKSVLNVNFSQGLDLKTDPFQVAAGKFLSLKNSIFDKAGRLTKRNGYGKLTNLPDNTATFLTTFNGDLTAIGTKLEAYSAGTDSWIDKGDIQPVSLSTLPLIRSSTNQSQADSAVASNGLVCTVYTDDVPSAGSIVKAYKYVIADSATGQNIVPPTTISVTVGTVTGSPRVFLLGNYFILLFTNVITATPHLQYIAISIYHPETATTNADIASAYVATPELSFDAVSVNNGLYVAYNTATGGQQVKITKLTTNLVVVSPVSFLGAKATQLSMCADVTSPSSPIIWAAWYDSASTDGQAVAVDQNLNTILAPTTIITVEAVDNITATAQSGTLSFFYEIDNNYSYDSSIATHYIKMNTLSQAGALGTASVIARSVGLASKAFLLNGTAYFLAIYDSIYQPTYFLINSSGMVLSKLAYSNGGGYDTVGLSNVTVIGTSAYIPYLIKDLLQAVNKTQGVASAAGVYSQTGINLVTFDLSAGSFVASEIGSTLNLAGGFIASYDGYAITEQNFFLWPDYVEVTTSGAGGSLTAQQYFYVATYEWADNQGNVYRSAPSIAVSVTTTGSTSSNTINVPTLRLTYKLANPAKIVIYRWSTAQQTYYQVTSLDIPTLNNTTVDSIAFVDTLADSAIIGNNILYTSGGVIENIAPPSSDIMTLFNNRLWLVDSEDRNLLWFSKQVIEATPVEMSDLLTQYIAPSTASQGSTGPITALNPMDDKLIIFKRDALGYINGIGPDNTGANNQYSDFVLINSVVGCDNQQSIVFTPAGLMFQSKKGIWILGRDLSTQYIGAPVETLTTGALVQSAVNVPETTQVRFTLDTGLTLMYDYFYGQWGSFKNVPAISSTIYQNLHTYVNSLGQVFQETPGRYLDNTSPVLLSFSTSWINLAGIQGFERFYQMLLLGTYITPFMLNVQFAYDYNPSIEHSVIATPDNYSAPWGGEAFWGSGGVWGGPSSVLEQRVDPAIQRCESFQITIDEVFDSSLGVPAGAGLTLSGLALTVGVKKGTRNSPASKSFG